MFNRAVNLTKRLGDNRLWSEISSFHNALLFYQGALQSCLTQSQQVEEMARRNNHRFLQNWGMRGQAECYLRLGNFAQAIDYAQKTLAFLEADENLQAIGSELGARAVLGMAYIRTGQVEKGKQP